MSDSTDESHVEFDEILDERPLRQGDVIEWHQAQQDRWRSAGIIVTADCDIAKGKHSGILSYVPVLTLEQYLEDEYVLRRVQKCKRDFDDRITATLNIGRKNTDMFPRDIGSESLLDWIQDVGIQAVIGELKIDEATSAQLLSDWEMRCRLHSAGCSGVLPEMLAALFEHGSRTSPAKKSKESDMGGQWIKKVVNESVDAIKKLPGDKMYLNQISSRRQNGNVVYLRMLREVKDTAIAITYDQFMDSETLARRTGRLRSPYIYRLTQMLGAVFSDIGLSGRHENERDSIVGRLMGEVSTRGVDSFRGLVNGLQTQRQENLKEKKS
jgi:hypothetical protein